MGGSRVHRLSIDIRKKRRSVLSRSGQCVSVHDGVMVVAQIVTMPKIIIHLEFTTPLDIRMGRTVT